MTKVLQGTFFLALAAILGLMIANSYSNLQESRDFKSKGKRNTFCDHVRHLQKDHGYKFSMPRECIGDETDIKTFLKQI